jgi:hypothetical protein
MNNNIINNNGWIGSTHIDNIKLTSNILEQHIILGAIDFLFSITMAVSSIR